MEGEDAVVCLGWPQRNTINASWSTNLTLRTRRATKFSREDLVGLRPALFGRLLPACCVRLPARRTGRWAVLSAIHTTHTP